LKIKLLKKYERYVLKKWNSEKKTTKIENNSIATFKIDWNDIVKYVFNFQFEINCREQIKLNFGDWWIMHLHHIGLPPATNCYQIVVVPGNY
jgi:hypothetical protein